MEHKMAVQRSKVKHDAVLKYVQEHEGQLVEWLEFARAVGLSPGYLGPVLSGLITAGRVVQPDVKVFAYELGTEPEENSVVRDERGNVDFETEREKIKQCMGCGLAVLSYLVDVGRTKCLRCGLNYETGEAVS